MEYNYKVVGMSAPKSFTLYESNDRCWAKDGLPIGHYEALFKKAKDSDTFWIQEITATVECEGLGLHGSPINGIVKEVFIMVNYINRKIICFSTSKNSFRNTPSKPKEFW